MFVINGSFYGNNIYHLKNSMEKAMEPHSSTLAWRVPWTEEPGGLQSMGPAKSRTRLRDFISFFTFMHWRRKWQPTPMFLPGEPQRWEPGGLPSMGCTELDTTDVT